MRLAECFNEKTEDEWKAVGRRLTQCEMMQHQRRCSCFKHVCYMCNKTAKLQFPVYAYIVMFAVFVHVCCVYEHLCVFVFLLVDQLMFVDLL